jgi:hypothetical protein
MSVTPENRRQPLLAGRPTAFPAANDYDRVGLQNLADRFRHIPAKIDPDFGFHRLVSRHSQELLFREIHRHRRRFEFQRVRNHLRDMNGNARAQAPRQPAGNIQRLGGARKPGVNQVHFQFPILNFRSKNRRRNMYSTFHNFTLRAGPSGWY